ncbi:hypothetical protein CLV84_2783 [Neolewinella xylanilytica]|uniref:Uncharacterized protein n=2 Tax=Neolewinella xylanilytica TaxID=1514080 RepID=A0A2S6I3X3_9BACT|nr:hypothetical protein CLV84_2783 [Neolewinella xylanilytica]
MTVLLNYADHHFRRAQQRNTKSARRVGGFDEVRSYCPQDIDPTFRRAHEGILNQEKGAGYWLWKPYFIVRTLNDLPDGTWLFYCDAGAHFVKPVDLLIRALHPFDQDVFPFSLHNHPELHWTRPEVFWELAPGRYDLQLTEQRIATCHLWRNGPEAKNFAASWLEYASRPELLLDPSEPDTIGNGFLAHRHDQSIFSVLSKLHNQRAFRDPSQFGNGRIGSSPNSPYPQIIELTRRRDVSLAGRIKRFLKSFLNG